MGPTHNNQNGLGSPKKRGRLKSPHRYQRNISKCSETKLCQFYTFVKNYEVNLITIPVCFHSIELCKLLDLYDRN